MKKLLLIRHAKATHESGYIDFERPLTPEDLQEAEVMASRLRAEGIFPDILVSSPALRTLSTANIFTQIMQLPKANTDKRIYDASENTLMEVVSELPDNYSFIGLVGHNPGFSQIFYLLCNCIKDTPTCTVAVIEFDADSWNDVEPYTGKLIYYDTPQV
ncbi:SixA phosphatase family protein [Mucilaginibacter segetis]|uniref:Histidine phosphatase family protein n=1 Tax=Mucilaginibacter segetis TaxID=2793071 RepID=A0A934PXG1_9SPHI|nr:histidine phosphatase family protein [Mucilaginibacter segetis]MBK0380876.1 histidine phosphatase family protein [Mucilaginibacter segetis]